MDLKGQFACHLVSFIMTFLENTVCSSMENFLQYTMSWPLLKCQTEFDALTSSLQSYLKVFTGIKKKKLRKKIF